MTHVQDANSSAFPCDACNGITKREFYTLAVLEGMVSDNKTLSGYNSDWHKLVHDASMISEALLEHFNPNT